MASNTSENFDKLIRELEYEIQMYVREIQIETQTIHYIEQCTEKLQQELEEENRMMPYLDQSVRACHQSFTCNRDMINSIKCALESAKVEEENLRRQLEELLKENEKMQKDHETMLHLYELKWKDYKECYENLPLAKKLSDSLKLKKELELENAEKMKELLRLKEEKEKLESQFRPCTGWVEFIVKLAPLRLEALRLEKEASDLEEKCQKLEGDIKLKYEQMKTLKQEEAQKMDKEKDGAKLNGTDEAQPIRGPAEGEEDQSGSDGQQERKERTDQSGDQEQLQQELETTEQQQQQQQQQPETGQEQQRMKQGQKQQKEQQLTEHEHLTVEQESRNEKMSNKSQEAPKGTAKTLRKEHLAIANFEIEIPRLRVPETKTNISEPAKPSVIRTPNIQLAVPRFSGQTVSCSNEQITPQVFKLPARINSPAHFSTEPILSPVISRPQKNTQSAAEAVTEVAVTAANIEPTPDGVTKRPAVTSTLQHNESCSVLTRTPSSRTIVKTLPKTPDKDITDIEIQLKKIKMLSKQSPGFNYGPGQLLYHNKNSTDKGEADTSELFTFPRDQFIQPLFGQSLGMGPCSTSSDAMNISGSNDDAEASKRNVSVSATGFSLNTPDKSTASDNIPKTAFNFGEPSDADKPSDPHACILTLFGDKQPDDGTNADDHSEDNFFNFDDSVTEDLPAFGSSAFSLF